MSESETDIPSDIWCGNCEKKFSNKTNYDMHFALKSYKKFSHSGEHSPGAANPCYKRAQHRRTFANSLEDARVANEFNRAEIRRCSLMAAEAGPSTSK